MELEAGPRLQRRQVQDHVPVLALAARLADEASLAVRRPGDRLPVGYLRTADVRLDLELAEESVLDDLQVQLAHAADDRLRRLRVRVDAEGRVLCGEAPERRRQLVLVRL